MKLIDILQKAKKELEPVSRQAYQESLWILSYTLNLPSSQIYLEKKTISPDKKKEFWQKINQRKQAFPLEYILKEKSFFGHKFYIEDPVFIPRPETETFLNWLCKNIPKTTSLKFIDFGAGAGTIALSILHHFTNSTGVAVELNPKAISCLTKNSINLQLQDRLYILQKDVSKIHPDDKPSLTALDLITANPPYIDAKDKSVQPEVYLYESPLALFSDEKGLGHIISWFEKAMELLKPKGLYMFEFAWNQEKQVINFLNSQEKIDTYTILKDQLGHPRIAVCSKKAGIHPPFS